ncbi:hypothetical protein ACWOA0_01605 [Ignavigranum ruoffiae]|uniref:Sensory transduction regulator n=1 Tax=Ignavigranum ruoffiae TaxID=89093 RepID=A0A1H8Z1C6_9LACT|nr:hypothetical protein [Ignavigranum ruoffiae]UPQ85449.1 hypothetical protein M0R79_07295 [Ignavigranum ruoffiae]SEP58319.1 hypothetical protein SAMN04488558_101116 [Ignavigranum ruoffiae]
MSKIQENFEQKLKSVDIPFNYQEIEDGHHLYRFTYQLSKSRKVIVEVIIQEAETDFVDGQIIYRQLHQLADRSLETKALSLLNDLNGMRTGYYALYLAGDGEIFLRNLVRLGQDPEAFYETIVMGSAIAKALIPDITRALGKPAE